MLICFPWKGSGGGVVYGCGVWRVKSWVKNVLNTNKYIAIFSIKWGWSRLTYLPLVVIIFEKSIILFYWTPYRGIETCCWILPAVHIHSIEPLIGGLRRFAYSFNVIFFIYWTPYWGIETRSVIVFFILPPSIEPLIGGLILSYHGAPPAFIIYWTPYRGIDTIFRVKTPCWQPIEPLIGGLIQTAKLHEPVTAGLVYWTPYRGIEMLICFPWKGSGGGVVYGFGVWRVKSWVKNVPNTNKHIAISPIKWGWSSLAYLSLVVIIFEKSIILFYWTPYRGIDTLFGNDIHHSFFYWTPYRGIDISLREWAISNE